LNFFFLSLFSLCLFRRKKFVKIRHVPKKTPTPTDSIVKWNLNLKLVERSRELWKAEENGYAGFSGFYGWTSIQSSIPSPHIYIYFFFKKKKREKERPFLREKCIPICFSVCSVLPNWDGKREVSLCLLLSLPTFLSACHKQTGSSRNGNKQTDPSFTWNPRSSTKRVQRKWCTRFIPSFYDS
jgi:hypothetical protein